MRHGKEMESSIKSKQENILETMCLNMEGYYKVAKEFAGL